MISFGRVIALFIALIAIDANSQNAVTGDREFLKKASNEKTTVLRSKNAFEIGKLEYFAQKDRFEIYEFDIDVLREDGQTFSISPFNGPPINIISHGITPDPNYGWMVGTWKGEVVSQISRATYPIELGIGIWAVGDNGKLRPPDPDREATLAALQQESYVVSEESVSRLSEKLVYSISGSIVLPDQRRQIEIVQLDDDLESLILYEIDTKKAIAPVSDTASQDAIAERAQMEQSEFGREQLKRIEAYELHVRNLRRELGIEDEPE